MTTDESLKEYKSIVKLIEPNIRKIEESAKDNYFNAVGQWFLTELGCVIEKVTLSSDITRKTDILPHAGRIPTIVFTESVCGYASKVAQINLHAEKIEFYENGKFAGVAFAYTSLKDDTIQISIGKTDEGKTVCADFAKIVAEAINDTFTSRTNTRVDVSLL